MLSLMGVAWGGPTSWTGRTPTGEMRAETKQVRMVHEELEIRLVDLDSYELRATYQMHNPGDRVIVRYGVPVTSGGTDGARPSSNAASVRILQDGVFVPCLVDRGEPLELPLSSESGMHEVDHWCTAELVFEPGSSEIRLSYEGGLFFERVMGEQGPEPVDRQLTYALGLASSWAKKPDAVEITVDLGTVYRARARKVTPTPSTADDRFLSWSLSKPDLAKTPFLTVELTAQDLDVFAPVSPTASTTQPTATGTTDPAALFDGDPSRSTCAKMPGTLELRWSDPPEQRGCRLALAGVPGEATDAVSWLIHGRVKQARLEMCSDPKVFTEVSFTPSQTPSSSATELSPEFTAAWWAAWDKGSPCVRIHPEGLLSGPEADVCWGEMSWQVRCP